VQQIGNNYIFYMMLIQLTSALKI